MRRLSRTASSPGFTLAEVMISVGLVGLVTGAVLLVFWNGIALWQRHEAESTAHLNSTQAVRRIVADARDGVQAKVYNRASGLWKALELVLPADTDADGNYVPVWDGKKLTYREGQRLLFYLSDATGAYDAGGDILWRATVPGPGPPSTTNLAPDADWSLYYDTGRGRVSAIENLDFPNQEGGKVYSWVAVTATAAVPAGDRIWRAEAAGRAHLRHCNQ